MTERRVEDRLTLWFRDEVVGERPPLELEASVMAIPDALPERRGLVGQRLTLLVAATLLIVAVVGSAVAVGTWLVRPPTTDVAPQPTPTASPSSTFVQGLWIPTGAMITARLDHTATRLVDGSVLVAGGNVGVTHSIDGSTERFDPIPGSWASTGGLVEARQSHTATLLPDGTVLVVGGQGSDGHPLASAERYDPASGTWTSTQSMVVPRSGHTATLLPDGTVLAAGGWNGVDSVLASAEVYDPADGTWTATGSMVAPHNQHTATLLLDGTVLVAGGDVASRRSGEGRAGSAPTVQSPQPFPAAEVYDPSTSSWTATENMVTPTVGHTATLLPDGTVLVAGGDVYRVESRTRGAPLSSAQRFDPTKGTWTATSKMTVARDVHMATLLPDGTVLVVGGFSAKGGPLLASAELYDPVSGRWSAAATMQSGRAFSAAALLLDGRVLVAGGLDSVEGQGNQLASAELYDADAP